MGAASSQYVSTFTESWTHPNVVPSVVDKPKHDPLEGFESGRQERGTNMFFCCLENLNYLFKNVRLLMKTFTGQEFRQIGVITVQII